jgi:hypothetical protein
VQPAFRKTEVVQSLTVTVAVLLFASWVRQTPDRTELGWRTAAVHFQPVTLDPSGFGELRLAGAWTVTSDDPRFGGISALAMDGRNLVAVTDSGAVVRMSMPKGGEGRARIGELPGGPGDPRFKVRRDSEALARDPAGRGWWVAFENRNELWLYDRSFRRALHRVSFGPRRWPHNTGIEAAATTDGTLLLLPEGGETVVEMRGSSTGSVRILNPAGRVSDAARSPSGELLVVNRRLTPRGFVNSLASLEASASGYRYVRPYELGVGRIDNMEAIAPEQLPDGRVRLWLMSDDNYQRPFRTLLIAVDVPLRPRALPKPSSPAPASACGPWC